MSDITPETIATVARLIDQQKGKYVKQILASLEQIAQKREERLDPAVRKAVLDGVNNMQRAIYRILGYDIEQ